MGRLSVAASIAAALAVLGPACGKDSTGAGAGVEAIVGAWKAKGLEPSAFVPSPEVKLDGARCRAGTISGLDATLCEFADEAAARKAEPAGRALVGETTGAAIASGRLLLVVADRRSADPNGRRINEITKTFRGIR